MRIHRHASTLGSPFRTAVIAIGLAVLTAGNPGGCPRSDDNSGGGNVPGSVVAGVLVENPPGQDPDDPDVPSSQLELASGAILDVRPSALDFGSSYSQISFTVQNIGRGTVNYAVQSAVPWATLSGTDGDSSGERDGFTVFVNRDGLEAGAHSGIIEVSAEGETVTVAITATVGDSASTGTLEVAPAALDFGQSTTAIPLTIRATRRAETAYTIESSAAWLNVDPSAGSSSGELDAVTAVINREYLAPGQQSATITVADSAGGTAQVNVVASGAATHAISGYIRNGSVGIGGVTVVASSGGGSGVTDSSGRYELQVPHAWYGSVAPTGAAFVYSPSNRIVTNTRGDVGSIDFVASDPAEFAPGFFIQWADWEGRIYRGGPHVSDDRMTASVRLVAEQQWELTIQNGPVEIMAVWFPWDFPHVHLNDQLTDDVMFTPLFAGVACLPHEVVDYGWTGFEYPGYAFAPLNVLADPFRSRVVAATMWPPQTVTPVYSLHRMSLWFRTPIPPGQTRRFTAISGFFEGDASRGIDPWTLAVDRYSSWLRGAMQAAGDYPNQAQWFRNSHGWMHIGLMGAVEFGTENLYATYDNYKRYFPHAQFWGQMSNYMGTEHPPVPPLEPGEQVGCCLPIRNMHPRYHPELVAFADYARANDGGVSLYTRPRPDEFGVEMPLDDPTILDGETNFQWYREWIRKNLEDYRANALYLDVLGRRPFGRPDVVRQALAGVPHESVMEGFSDAYPYGALISGFVHGQIAGGLPERTLERLGQGYSRVSVPRYGRYLLPDRYAFLGESNSDENYWGPSADHLVERQVFLLGAKFDVATLWADVHRPMEMAPMLQTIIAERERVNWWPRNPQYRDRLGITDLPADVDARHFIASDGKSLLVIENWNQTLGRWFTFYGRTIGVPMARLSIVEVDPFSN